MQKKIIASLLLVSAMSCAMETEEIKTAEVDMRTPLDENWFYAKHDYSKANGMAGERKWELAEKEYDKLLAEKKGPEYDQRMARLNKAAAQFAQDKESDDWQVFDEFGTPDKNRMTRDDYNRFSSKSTVLVNTHQIGIGDIFHFLKATDKLHKDTGAQVTLVAKGFLHNALGGAAEAYNFTLKTHDDPEKYTFTTHLVSLLGHLKMQPQQLAPEKVVLTTSEAVGKITQAIAPYQKQNKKIAVVFLGEEREATVMGGRKLRRRHLDAKAFEQLLRIYPELIIMDCNTKKHRIYFDEHEVSNHTAMSPEFKGRVIELPDEDDAFDTIIAMALVANGMGTDYVGFCADNGPPNVFARALSKDAQRRTAFIIPKSDSSDMRMEGSGSAYKQGLSDCWVYRCNKSDKQDEVILGAGIDMLD